MAESNCVLAGPSAGLAQARPTTLAPYRIGLTYPLAGPFATNAETSLPAIELAVADVNEKGGVKGHPLQHDPEDTAGTPAGGVESFRKLTQVDGVQAVMTIYTNVVEAQIPLADRLHVPSISRPSCRGYSTSLLHLGVLAQWRLTVCRRDVLEKGGYDGPAIRDQLAGLRISICQVRRGKLVQIASEEQ